MSDEEIILLLFQRSELGLTELNTQYGKLCHQLSYNILKDRADAEECVNDAYLGVWDSVPPQNPNPLVTYLCKIVRNISLKRYCQKTAKKRNSIYDVALSELDAFLPSKNTVESEVEAKELAVIIEKFLDTLSEENRIIFMSRYWFADTYADISKRVGLSEKNVSVRLTRARRQLKQYLIEREVWL